MNTPTSCSDCYPGYTLSSGSCSFDTTKYPHLYYVGYYSGSDSNISNLNAFSYVSALSTSNMAALPWTGMACVLNRQIIPVCKPAHYYDETSTFTCIACTVGCSACTSSTKCTACDKNYFYDSTANSCTLCDTYGSGCSSKTEPSGCTSHYYKDTTTKKCTECPTGSTCSDAKTITACLPTYYKKTADDKTVTCETC